MILRFGIPSIAAVYVLFTMRHTISYFRTTVMEHVYHEAIVSTQVFLYGIEQQRGVESEENLLQTVMTHVVRYDEEYAINSLLVDTDCNLLSRRVVTVPFCDPFEMPVDTEVMKSEIKSGKSSGYFRLHCPDADGVLQPCYWYYQRIDLCGSGYYVLAGVQPVAVSAVVNVNALWLPMFLFGVVVVGVLWMYFYEKTKNWRDPESRTRKEDVLIESGNQMVGVDT